MRVIAGKARHIQLKTVDSMNTRPTTDRIKETLFNMIQNDLYDCSFLDLFSGSGAIGIEALSRGAREAVFVEKDRAAIGCIKENLQKTKLYSQARIYETDVFNAIDRMNNEAGIFDFIFMDPPYNKDLEKTVLEKIREKSFISEDTTIIAEASLDTDFSYCQELGYEIVKTKKYKTNKHVFIKLDDKDRLEDL